MHVDVASRETIDIPVTIAWNGLGEGEIAPEATINLISSTGENFTLTGTDSVLFGGVRKYDSQNQLITYTIEQLPIEWFTTEVSEFSVTNTKVERPKEYSLTPETVEATLVSEELTAIESITEPVNQLQVDPTATESSLSTDPSIGVDAGEEVAISSPEGMISPMAIGTAETASGSGNISSGYGSYTWSATAGRLTASMAFLCRLYRYEEGRHGMGSRNQGR